MMLVVVAVHSHVRLDDYVPSLRRVLHWPRTAVVAIPCCVDQSMEVAEAGEQSEGGRLDDEAVRAGWGKKQRASTNKKRKRLVVPSKEYHDYGVFSIQRIVRVFDLPEGAGTGLGGDRSRPGRSTKGDSTAREGTSKQGQPQPSVESVGGIGQDTSRGQQLQRHGQQQQQQQQSAIEVGDEPRVEHVPKVGMRKDVMHQVVQALHPLVLQYVAQEHAAVTLNATEPTNDESTNRGRRQWA